MVPSQRFFIFFLNVKWSCDPHQLWSSAIFCCCFQYFKLYFRIKGRAADDRDWNSNGTKQARKTEQLQHNNRSDNGKTFTMKCRGNKQSSSFCSQLTAFTLRLWDRTGLIDSRQGQTHTGIRAAAHPENLTDDLSRQEPACSKVLTRHHRILHQQRITFPALPAHSVANRQDEAPAEKTYKQHAGCPLAES